MTLSFSYEDLMREMVQVMREELTQAGYEELRTPEEVDEVLGKEKGTVLVVVNSVCGCAGAIARPAAVSASKHRVKPERLVTVFAGQDREATERARSYFTGYEPSSPSIALMKDGKVVYMIERHNIENRQAEAVANELVGAFERYCG
mgnify:FL=1